MFGKVWSLNSNVMPDDEDYYSIFGFGYSKFYHASYGVIQELEVFVPTSDSVKVSIARFKNTTSEKRKFKFVYYVKPVLGEDETKTSGYIDLKLDGNVLFAKNVYSESLSRCVYIGASEKITSYTGNNLSFVGNSNLHSPKAIEKTELDNINALGVQSCIAIQFEFELDAFEEKNVVLTLGEEEDKSAVLDTYLKYSTFELASSGLRETKTYWSNMLRKLQVKTDRADIDFMLNGWAMYQTIVCRLYAKSAYYQSGGAFGFRDQLQDSLSLKFLDTDFLKNQIIKHSEHQFEEGDVLHWWHDDTKRGIRTKFSDDLLWLVYAVCEYAEFTGDFGILDIETSYVSGNLLGLNEDEKYDLYEAGEVLESIYKHCIRAIEKSLNFGVNGLPKIGSGDWNDGFSTVGNKGKGESVWLRIFLV